MSSIPVRDSNFSLFALFSLYHAHDMFHIFILELESSPSFFISQKHALLKDLPHRESYENNFAFRNIMWLLFDNSILNKIPFIQLYSLSLSGERRIMFFYLVFGKDRKHLAKEQNNKKRKSPQLLSKKHIALYVLFLFTVKN